MRDGEAHLTREPQDAAARRPGIQHEQSLTTTRHIERLISSLVSFDRILLSRPPMAGVP